MAWDEEDDTTIYRVLVNDRRELMVVPADSKLEPGWREEGTRGTKRVCLDHLRRRGRTVS